MFTWICPQCGAEVPPAYTDCPNCKPVAAEAPTIVHQPAPPAPPQRTVTLPPPPPARVMGPPRPTAPTPTAPQPITYAPPQQLQYQAPPQRPQYQAPPQPQYQPPPPPQEPVLYAYPPPASGTPAWLVTIGVFVGLTVAGYAFYALVLNKHGASASSQREEKASDAKGRGGRDLSKNLEAAGIRIIEENRKPTIKLMLVNHSASDMASLTGTVRLTTDAQHEVAVIPFTLASLAAFEAKDISAPLKTKLRAYELPDWQFIKAEVQLKPAAE